MTSSYLYHLQGPYFQMKSHSQVLAADFNILLGGHNSRHARGQGVAQSVQVSAFMATRKHFAHLSASTQCVNNIFV